MKANVASATAKVIAANTLLLAADKSAAQPVAPGAADLCRRFLSTSLADRLLALSATCICSRWAWHLLERFTHPGIIEHYWSRKRWIERRVRQALDAGSTRLIILGAGFDTLGSRLAAEFPNLEVLEVDHPATQSVKAAAMLEWTQRPPRFLPVDLRSEIIPAAAFDNSKRSVVVAEGLLMYLPVADLNRLFATLRSASGELELIFSFMSRWPDGSSGFRPRSRLIEYWLKRTGEPFAWAIAPTDIGQFLTERGFSLSELALTPSFAVPGNRLEGENLVRCAPQR